MLRKIVSLVMVLGALAAFGTAHAGTLTYSNYTIIDPQRVTLSGDALGRRETATAGEITLLGINGGTGALSTFCIDVADWLTPAGQFSTGAYLIGSFAEQVNALLTHVLPTLGTNGYASSALQVAIWQAEYGSRLTVGGNAAVLDLAAQYLGAVQSGLWTADGSMKVAVLNGNGVDQSQAYLARVPEPASFAVLGMALLGAAAWRFRRQTPLPVYSRLARRSINCRPRRPLN